MTEYLVVALALLGVLILGGLGLVVPRLRRRPEPPLPQTEVDTRAEEDLAGPPVEARGVRPLHRRPGRAATGGRGARPALEVPEPTAGRLVRLRSRLSRSQNVFGKGLLGLLARDHLDEDTWEEIEDSLITADVGVDATREIVDRLRERTRVLGTRSGDELRDLLADELIAALDPTLDRSLRTAPHGRRARRCVLVVGVNGAGKTTTCGKIARVLVADGHSVRARRRRHLPRRRRRPAGDLGRPGRRRGRPRARRAATRPRSPSTRCKRGIETGVDTVLIDTAGRLQNKVGLMDELGKVKRVVEKHGPVDETLLVLDATTGQNGLEQARVFTEVVNVTGVVLTKLDGTAKGGIVIAVQRKLGIPVKLVGLGEGPDDLAPFDPAQFVDALLGTEPLARDA